MNGSSLLHIHMFPWTAHVGRLSLSRQRFERPSGVQKLSSELPALVGPEIVSQGIQPTTLGRAKIMTNLK